MPVNEPARPARPLRFRFTMVLHGTAQNSSHGSNHTADFKSRRVKALLLPVCYTQHRSRPLRRHRHFPRLTGGVLVGAQPAVHREGRQLRTVRDQLQLRSTRDQHVRRAHRNDRDGFSESNFRSRILGLSFSHSDSLARILGFVFSDSDSRIFKRPNPDLTKIYSIRIRNLICV